MPDLEERIAGGLMGLAIGDALGATLEFLTPAAVAAAFPSGHRDIIGGGPFAWRPGQGTDDTDLTFVVVEAIAHGDDADEVAQLAAEGMLRWFDGGPPDVGDATARALLRYRGHRDPQRSGCAEGDRGNGSLMRTLPIGLARPDAPRRAREAASVSRITHADSECVDACITYCEIVAALLEGAEVIDAIARGGMTSSVTAVTAAVDRGALRPLGAAIRDGLLPQQHDNRGYVLDSLSIAVAALVDPRPAAEVLIDVVNLGGDADTTGAIAGGLLGVRDGRSAWPEHWVDALEYGPRLDPAAAMLHDRWNGVGPLTR